MNKLSETWKKDGVFIERHVIDEARASRLTAICEKVFEKWRQHNPMTGKPGGDESAVSMLSPHHADYFEGNDSLGHADLVELLEIAAEPKVVDPMRDIFGEDVHFRSMNFFINPKEGGRDGHWHRDTQFQWKVEEEERRVFEKIPPEGLSVQVQLALVPSSAVEVVPGSQSRWDTPEEHAIRRNRENWTSNDMPGAMRADLGTGDMVAFNPAILHRGRYDVEKPRRTLMFAYTPASRPWEDRYCIQPWFLRPGYLDGLTEGARDFYDRFIEQYRKNWF